MRCNVAGKSPAVVDQNEKTGGGGVGCSDRRFAGRRAFQPAFPSPSCIGFPPIVPTIVRPGPPTGVYNSMEPSIGPPSMASIMLKIHCERQSGHSPRWLAGSL